MKIPKYIYSALSGRIRAANDLDNYNNKIIEWLNKQGIVCDYFYKYKDDIRFPSSTNKRLIEVITRTVAKGDPVCSCYHIEYDTPRCWGTKECEPCNCQGNTKYCDFYPEKRKK